ncbi:acyl-CoA dehydrogenase [Actinoallomurus rhizosphaericola]|uniref:acyl-CoA dehydrogenase n=1 Tax=Actinoallomurus rhizosphaericola TaxID=2952536 RepID=UPI002092E705|nr:acyl-CoA dehydrogenase [Actinoallomurus rhizosphaericola]MCO5997672.1 acyl-CoA dehydrogenase [Actinoallomurus rhizosphaericola]
MGIGLTEEHEELAASVRRFAERHAPRTVVRDAVADEQGVVGRSHGGGEQGVVGRSHEGGEQARPAYWAELAGQGLLGLHLPEEHGGQGFSVLELAVAVEEMGRALVPGPYVPTVLASAVIAAADVPPAHRELLPGLAEGTLTGAVCLAAGLTGRRTDDGLVVGGGAGPVLGGPAAGVLVAPVTLDDGGETWVVLRRREFETEAPDALDAVRGAARVASQDAVVPAGRVLTGLTARDVRALAAVILGAEACGVAAWAVETAASYARTREQFGRPIGQFQGVKHRCARMLIELEKARAAVWDAAQAVTAGDQVPYATGVAAVVAPDAAVFCAQDCIQVHGGIGYTFEHDAHLYYRRALTLRAVLGRAADHRASVADLAMAGETRERDLDLPPEAEPLRREIRARVAELAALDGPERIGELAAGGWVQPHLPRPWGRDASPLEQVVIHRELRAAAIEGPWLGIGAWVAPSLAAYGTPEQQERFLPATLRGEIVWCQLFSEPGAGSDLAGLRTRAERCDGGWRISGQKIWTSLAQHAQWGICLARTDPDAPKREGITYFLVDMAAPGVQVRPLRDLTGAEVFNEVFLDEVFVPDSLVVGPVNAGWRVARVTLTAERVNLSTGWQLGADVPRLLDLVRDLGLAGDPVVRDGVGGLVADAHVFALLGLRATLKRLSGVDAGATANVSKLVGMEHGQRVTEYGFGLLDAEGALIGPPGAGPRAEWTRLLLASRAMTIGGGTTEVNLNVIAERLLGLPRDPEPGR